MYKHIYATYTQRGFTTGNPYVCTTRLFIGKQKKLNQHVSFVKIGKERGMVSIHRTLGGNDGQNRPAPGR
jgi:hypothetical protein